MQQYMTLICIQSIWAPSNPYSKLIKYYNKVTLSNVLFIQTQRLFNKRFYYLNVIYRLKNHEK